MWAVGLPAQQISMHHKLEYASIHQNSAKWILQQKWQVGKDTEQMACDILSPSPSPPPKKIKIYGIALSGQYGD